MEYILPKIEKLLIAKTNEDVYHTIMLYFKPMTRLILFPYRVSAIFENAHHMAIRELKRLTIFQILYDKYCQYGYYNETYSIQTQISFCLICGNLEAIYLGPDRHKAIYCVC